MVWERDLAITLGDNAVIDEPGKRRREGAVRDAQTASQLLARHARTQRMGRVIFAKLFAGAYSQSVPVLRRPDPFGDAPGRQLVHPARGGQGRLEQRGDADAARVLAQLLL